MLFGVEGLQVTDAEAGPDGMLEVWAVTDHVAVSLDSRGGGGAGVARRDGDAREGVRAGRGRTSIPPR